VSIVGTPAVNPRTKFVLHRMMETIALDPGWHAGRYQTNPTVGLTAALMHLVPWWFVYDWYADNLSDPAAFQRFEQKWRGIFVSQIPQDARDVYYQLQAWSSFNLGDTPGFNGNTQAALQAIQVPTLLIGGAGDPLVHRQEIRAASRHIPHATHVEIDSAYGHACCIGVDVEATEVMTRAIRDFLERLQ
jgi:homoserine O-acetyltransferase